jgi:hypothetical protein
LNDADSDEDMRLRIRAYFNKSEEWVIKDETKLEEETYIIESEKNYILLNGAIKTERFEAEPATEVALEWRSNRHLFTRKTGFRTIEQLEEAV